MIMIKLSKLFIFDSLLLSEQLLKMTRDALPTFVLLIIVEVLLQFLRVPAGVSSGLLLRLILACIEFIVHLVKVHNDVAPFIVDPIRLCENIILLFVANA